MGGLEVLPEQDSGEGKDLEENSSCHWGCEPLGYKAMGWGTLTESPGRPLPSKNERGQDPGGGGDHRRRSPGQEGRREMSNSEEAENSKN